jgi:hypothetical protein
MDTSSRIPQRNAVEENFKGEIGGIINSENQAASSGAVIVAEMASPNRVLYTMSGA